MPTGKRLSIEEIKFRINKVHGDSVKLIESTYVNTNTKCKFMHSVYGIWETDIFSVFRGSTHPSVFINKKRVTIEELKNRIFDLHGDSVKLKESTYVDFNTRCVFIHVEHGEWTTFPADVLRGSTHRAVSAKKRRLTEEEMKERLLAAHGESVKIDWATYSNIDTPCRFIHVDHGEWVATPSNVLAGCGPPWLRHLKIGKTSANKIIKFHWKTQEKLVCQASWEPKVVDYLNKNKIEYKWQPLAFSMPSGKTYTPDLFLVNENKWIEIKGYFRKDAKLKWDWFLTQFPDSELWDKRKLIDLGIL